MHSNSIRPHRQQNEHSHHNYHSQRATSEDAADTNAMIELHMALGEDSEAVVHDIQKHDEKELNRNTRKGVLTKLSDISDLTSDHLSAFLEGMNERRRRKRKEPLSDEELNGEKATSLIKNLTMWRLKDMAKNVHHCAEMMKEKQFRESYSKNGCPKQFGNYHQWTPDEE